MECNSLSYTPFCYRWLAGLLHFLEVDVFNIGVREFDTSQKILMR